MRRPVFRAEVLASAEVWRSVEFLVDTGADRTVLSANVLDSLGLDRLAPLERIGGVGGLVDSVSVRTQIRLTRDDHEKVIFRGEYAACTDARLLDMSVLGRDILNLFALIVDHSARVVALIGGQHRCAIEQR